MNVKKSFLLFVMCALALGNVFGATTNSKYGYFDLAWGSTLAQITMKGYELTQMDEDVIASEQSEYKKPISIYTLNNKKDKFVVNVAFYFCDGKLFKVTEVLNKSMASASKLAGRYGKFSETGVYQTSDKNVYQDHKKNKEGFVSEASIFIRIAGETVEVRMFDFSVLSKINRKTLKATGKATIADDFYELSTELIKNTDKSKKISMAFVALSSDAQNKFVENYVTDALTQSVFETGNVRIIERSNLEKILSEQKFQSSGLVDDNSAKEIGKIAGVDYVCYGDMKDIGNEITVNARIVDVESGEVLAISRTTVDKDKYLRDYAVAQKKVEQEKVEKAKQEKRGKENAESLAKAKWQVTKNRNEFDEYTTYTFTCRTTTGQYLIVGYDKYDVSMYSLVRVGFYWSDNSDSVRSYDGNWPGIFDVKSENGDVYKVNLGDSTNDNKWSFKAGWKKAKNDYVQLTWSKAINQKELLEIYGSNNVVVVRNEKYDFVKRFETAKFWEVLAANGITKEEIFAAIDNEKF